MQQLQILNWTNKKETLQKFEKSLFLFFQRNTDVQV